MGVVLSLIGAVAACDGDQKSPTQAEVANGEALPSAPPVPAEPAATDSPASAPAPVVERASVDKQTRGPVAAEDAVLTEGQVAFLADLASSAEVEQGKLAQGKAKSPVVKKFADMMVKDHAEALQEQAKLFKKAQAH